MENYTHVIYSNRYHISGYYCSVSTPHTDNVNSNGGRRNALHVMNKRWFDSIKSTRVYECYVYSTINAMTVAVVAHSTAQNKNYKLYVSVNSINIISHSFGTLPNDTPLRTYI